MKTYGCVRPKKTVFVQVERIGKFTAGMTLGDQEVIEASFWCDDRIKIVKRLEDRSTCM